MRKLMIRVQNRPIYRKSKTKTDVFDAKTPYIEFGGFKDDLFPAKSGFLRASL